MLLAFHIISAVLGIAGAYIAGAVFFYYAYHGVIRTTGKLFKTGYWFTLTGLAGTVISGISLFTTNTQQFLESGKFISNMTVVLVLIGIELSFPILRAQRPLIANRAASLLSWTWIFAVALFNPMYPYWYFLAVYLIALCVIVYTTPVWFALSPTLTEPKNRA